MNVAPRRGAHLPTRSRSFSASSRFTAAPRQNDGQPEDTAAAVVDFMLTHAGTLPTAEAADRDGEVSARTVASRLRAIR